MNDYQQQRAALIAETHISLRLGVGFDGFNTEILPVSELTGNWVLKHTFAYLDDVIRYARYHSLPVHYSRKDLGEAYSRSLFAKAAEKGVTLVEKE